MRLNNTLPHIIRYSCAPSFVIAEGHALLHDRVVALGAEAGKQCAPIVQEIDDVALAVDFHL